MQTRRAFLGSAGILSAWGLVRFLPGCSAPDNGKTPTDPQHGAAATTPPKTPTDGDEYVANPPAQTPPQNAEVGNADWEAKAKALVASNVGGAAYTQDAPGPFAGKERAHVPVLTVQSDGVAVVVVNHVMDPGSSGSDGGMDAAADAKADAASADAAVRPTHYVSTIWVTNDQGQVLFMKEFLATDPAPPFIALRVPDGTKSLTAWEHCNLHGVWASAPG